jgi:ubiquinol-cytochrome c reductase cytochrome b subunit
MYIMHVLLIPGLILALVTAHVFISFHQKHTAMPALGNSERSVRGQPFYPYFLLKGTAWFFFIFGTLAVLATFAQINPIWLYGPYTPLAISFASQPVWYLGILEGALRVMPAWEVNFLGHTLSLSVLIPFALPLGIILGGAASWPFFERWVTGDKAAHHINDRPRNVPTRTGIGVAVQASSASCRPGSSSKRSARSPRRSGRCSPPAPHHAPCLPRMPAACHRGPARACSESLGWV